MNKKRITILLGAGAVAGETHVNTYSITKKIIDSSAKNDTVPYLIKIIAEELATQIINSKMEITSMKDAIKITNFEDIYNTLELLRGYLLFSPQFEGEKNLSSYHVFTNISTKMLELYDNNVGLLIGDCTKALRSMIELINDEIYNYDKEFKNKGTVLKNFLNQVSCNGRFALDVYNLNYDSWVEQSLSKIKDGFRLLDYKQGIYKFDPVFFLKKDNWNRIAHLHGQIYYGRILDTKYRILNQLNPDEQLLKLRDYQLCKKYRTHSYLLDNRTQNGEMLYPSNIITGMLKVEKLYTMPFETYQSQFLRSLIENERLIIVGYGFSDLYINHELEMYIGSHKKKKIIWIDYLSEQEFLHTSSCMVFSSLEKQRFMRRIYNQSLLHKDNFKNILCEEYCMTPSKNGIIFIKGIANAQKFHMDEIKSVLK